MAEAALTTGMRLRADLALLLCTAIWGFTFVVVKDSLGLADPFSFLAARFLLGALALTAIAGKTLADRRTLSGGALMGVLLFGGYSLQTVGLDHTTPSRSAFITGLAVLLVPFASFVVFRRAPRIFSLVGIGLAVLGLYSLTVGAEKAAGAADTKLGDLLTLCCAVLYAFHIVLTERFAPDVKPTAFVAVQLWVVSALSLPALLFIPARFALLPLLVFGVVVTGLFATAFAIALQTWAQRRTTAVRAALIFSLEPLFAAVLSVALGRERFGRPEFVGGSLIISGVVVAELGGALLERRRRLQKTGPA